MATVSGWLADNWFILVQGAGIIGGLLFAAVSMRRDTQARKASDLLTLTAHHRDLWSRMQERPELHRILKEEVDLVGQPISSAEEQYLNEVIVHFNTGWLLAKSGALIEEKSLAEDIRSFFSLPVPAAIWKGSRQGRDPKFVRFVEKCLGLRRQR